MEWREDGVLLAVRRHGETSAIVEVFTAAQGRHAGIVRGGTSRRIAPILQPGAELSLTWRARLQDHLGSFTVEPRRGRAAALMGDRLGLAGLNAICGLLCATLPERQAFPALHATTRTLLDLLAITPAWPLAYLQWEVALLAEMGFALELTCCAVTSRREGLAFVSPRTGRALTLEGAGEYADRLLPLPPCLLGRGSGGNAEIARALGTTGHFLERHALYKPGASGLPASRGRLVDLLARYSAGGGAVSSEGAAAAGASPAGTAGSDTTGA